MTRDNVVEGGGVKNRSSLARMATTTTTTDRPLFPSRTLNVVTTTPLTIGSGLLPALRSFAGFSAEILLLPCFVQRVPQEDTQLMDSPRFTIYILFTIRRCPLAAAVAPVEELLVLESLWRRFPASLYCTREPICRPANDKEVNVRSYPKVFLYRLCGRSSRRSVTLLLACDRARYAEIVAESYGNFTSTTYSLHSASRKTAPIRSTPNTQFSFFLLSFVASLTSFAFALERALRDGERQHSSATIVVMDH